MGIRSFVRLGRFYGPAVGLVCSGVLVFGPLASPNHGLIKGRDVAPASTPTRSTPEGSETARSGAGSFARSERLLDRNSIHATETASVGRIVAPLALAGPGPRTGAPRTGSGRPPTSVTPGTSPSASPVTTTTATSHQTGIGPYAGELPAFSATFGGTSLNANVWTTCYWFGCTNFGNPQEVEWYKASQDEVSGGVLHEVALEQPTPGTMSTGAPKTYPYRSGMVTTYNSFSFLYGYVQVVAKLPGGTGTWPALWLLPQSKAWPPEIDIMENWGTPHTISSTLHWVTSTGTREQTYKYVTVPENLTTTYNTYGVLWQPGSITWYLDGEVIHTFTGTEVPSVPMYFLANLAIDGSVSSSSSFDVQSVQIYTNS
jgi:hypothetical protein